MSRLGCRVFALKASELRLRSRLTLLALQLLSVLSRRLEEGIANLIVRRLGGKCLSSVGLLLKRFFCHEVKSRCGAARFLVC